MPESEDVAKDIREIKWHQEAIDASLELLLRANREEILREIKKVFGRSRRRAQIYLVIDGSRSVSEMGDMLGVQSPNISPVLGEFKDAGLIEIKRIESDGSYIYRKRRVDRILGISKMVREKFNL
ncbi:MAG: hypothetical protein ACOC3C_05560 [Candidatus Thorarchaeota archaeon]